MAALNSCQFIGNLGRDPEVKQTQGGTPVANLSIGVSERWKDRDGNKQERTTWVPVVIWGPLADVAGKYLRKGSKIFVCGKFSVRKWQDKDGNDRWSTEIVLQGPQAQLIMLDSAPGNGGGNDRQQSSRRQEGANNRFATDDDDLDDQIPF